MEIDTEQPPAVFKMQLFSLTGVPPERQKIMGVKGGLLKASSLTLAPSSLAGQQQFWNGWDSGGYQHILLILRMCHPVSVGRTMLSGPSWGSSPARSCP